MYKHDVYKFQFRTCSRSKYLRFIHCLWIHTVNFNKVNFCKPQLNCKKKKKRFMYHMYQINVKAYNDILYIVFKCKKIVMYTIPFLSFDCEYMYQYI